jgi:site-specific DNA recombinase
MGKIAAIYCRVSTEDQEREGTSLQTQLEACLNYCKNKGYDVVYRFSDAYSGLKLDRPKLNELRELIRNKQIDVLVVYCLDRFSRDPTHGVILTQELERHNVIIEAVTETVDSSELGKLINYIKGFASKLEAEKIGERTMRGKRRYAEMGEIPSSFGRCNYWGLRYDKERKRFDHIPGVIHIPKEILKRGIAGESSSTITVDLQKRGVLSATGGKIHRSAVSRVLSHARVYAGILEWNGYSILGKVEPIITEDEANIIAERLKRNKEKSYGFGKRKPLTGRIFCGLCGRRYSLDAKKGCRCNGSDPRNPAKCPAPKIGLKTLTDCIYEALGLAMMDDEALIKRTAELREKWEKETVEIEGMFRDKKEQLANFDKRRRLLSVQHELGGITDDEYVSRFKAVKREEDEFTEQLTHLKKFTPAE